MRELISYLDKGAIALEDAGSAAKVEHLRHESAFHMPARLDNILEQRQ
jgi:hypothetical protein